MKNSNRNSNNSKKNSNSKPATKSSKKFKLKRNIGLVEATLYGVGIILGAGIYALIGAAAGVAGNALWISFIIGAVVAAFTGFSYAELSSMYPKEAAEYVYTKNAFKKNYLSFIVEWIMFFTTIISATTVALGFAGYFSNLFGGNIVTIAALLIGILSFLNYYGIKESAKYNNLSTIIEFSGLVLVIIAGLYYIPKYAFDGVGYIDFFAAKDGLHGIMTATALIFFAFIGFENVANLSEETKNAKKVIPKALLLSLVISAILYVLVSVAAIGILGSDELAASKGPLADVINKVFPGAGYVLSIIALFATSNTVLVMLIIGSRLLYGLSCNNSLPAVCKVIGSRGTPYISVGIVGLLAIVGLFLGSIKKVALLTDVGIFIVYLVVNLSLIVLRYKVSDSKRAYKAPLNIGRFSVTAFLGIITCMIMLYFFELELILYEIAALGVGFIIYLVFNSSKRVVNKG
ncbi:amino acid permease [Candidatus Woesearchaeota archaeon]|nr:amino acid permease [Candidatus Woesearchaeota archaeon]